MSHNNMSEVPLLVYTNVFTEHLVPRPTDQLATHTHTQWREGRETGLVNIYIQTVLPDYHSSHFRERVWVSTHSYLPGLSLSLWATVCQCLLNSKRRRPTSTYTALSKRVWKCNGKKVVFCIGWRAISDTICSLGYVLGNTVNM